MEAFGQFTRYGLVVEPPRTIRSGPIGSARKRVAVVSRKASRPREDSTAISAIRRVPSTSRRSWTMTSTALLIWSRSASKGIFTSDMEASVCSLSTASSAELACTVASEPSWPVDMACSMSRVSPPRTSPTMIRSGRMRSEFRTRSRMVILPCPSTLGGRLSRRTTCSCWSWSSAASSTVMMRSPSGMSPDSELSSVVLPEPVPPLTMMLNLARTSAESSISMCSSRVPRPISSCRA